MLRTIVSLTELIETESELEELNEDLLDEEPEFLNDADQWFWELEDGEDDDEDEKEYYWGEMSYNRIQTDRWA